MPTTTFFNLPEQKREKLLAAARAEFARVPYSDASINKIIQSADIPRGSFYMYFADKEDLFLYLLEEYAKKLLALMRRLLAQWGGDLFAAFSALFDFLQQNRLLLDGDSTLEHLIAILRRNADLPPNGYLFSLRQTHSLHGLLTLVDTSKLQLVQQTDLQTIFHLLMGTTVSMVCLSLASEAPASVRAQYQNLLVMFQRGMAAPSFAVSPRKGEQADGTDPDAARPAD